MEQITIEQVEELERQAVEARAALEKQNEADKEQQIENMRQFVSDAEEGVRQATLALHEARNQLAAAKAALREAEGKPKRKPAENRAPRGAIEKAIITAPESQVSYQTYDVDRISALIPAFQKKQVMSCVARLIKKGVLHQKEDGGHAFAEGTHSSP